VHQWETDPPSWRTSVKSRGCTDCDVVKQVEERKDYALNVRLSNDEEGVEGGQVSNVMGRVFEAIPEGESTTLKDRG